MPVQEILKEAFRRPDRRVPRTRRRRRDLSDDGHDVSTALRPAISACSSCCADVTAESRLEALKEEFFQSAAHEPARAPLFAIQGYLRLLRKSLAPDERQANYLEAIDQSCEKAHACSSRTRSIPRAIENGHLRLAPGRIDARAPLARRTATLFQAARRRGAASFSRPAIANDAPASFEADERLVERLCCTISSPTP